jgi:hypothetical protein
MHDRLKEALTKVAQQAAPAQADFERRPCGDLRHAKWLDPECYGAGACQSLKFKAAPAQARDPWRDAIDEALVSSCLDCIGPNDTPTQALARLIQWEKTMALDPAISKEARDLVASGAAQSRQPLTDERLTAILSGMNAGLSGFRGWKWQDFARAIEAAHGITAAKKGE